LNPFQGQPPCVVVPDFDQFRDTLDLSVESRPQMKAT